MSELQTTPRLSLFQIEAELLGLVERRDDVLEMRDALSRDGITPPPEMEAELTTIDGLIRDYLKAEIKKVDGIAFCVKEFEARSAARAEEAAKMKAQADRDAETAKRIKAMVLEVMQEFNEKKLPGRLFTITRQGNGGVQALTIAQPDLVPDQRRKVTVTMGLLAWKAIVHTALASYWDVTKELYKFEEEPDTQAIREALKRGEGVPGARLEPLGEHVRIK